MNLMTRIIKKIGRLKTKSQPASLSTIPDHPNETSVSAIMKQLKTTNPPLISQKNAKHNRDQMQFESHTSPLKSTEVTAEDPDSLNSLQNIIKKHFSTM